jgi:hypothetical protein
VITIAVKISAAGREGDKLAPVKPLIAKATGAARVMAQALYDDAHTEGKRRKAHFSNKSRRYLSDAYMQALGGRFANKGTWADLSEQWRKTEKSADRARLYVSKEPGGAWSWRDSALWHRIARKDDESYDRTGGMWSGLQVRNFGSNSAIVEFAGQSLGQSGEMKWKRGRLREGEQRQQVYSGKVTNRLKAWTVFNEFGFHVLLPYAKTQEAFEDAVTAMASDWSQITLGVGVTARADPDRGRPVLTQHFLDAMRGTT